MHLPSPLHVGLLLSAAPIAAATFTLPNPFERVKGSAEAPGREALRVDLGYEIYEGVGNAATGVDTYRGYVTDSSCFCSSASLSRHIVRKICEKEKQWKVDSADGVMTGFAMQRPRLDRSGGRPRLCQQ